MQVLEAIGYPALSALMTSRVLNEALGGNPRMPDVVRSLGRIFEECHSIEVRGAQEVVDLLSDLSSGVVEYVLGSLK